MGTPDTKVVSVLNNMSNDKNSQVVAIINIFFIASIYLDLKGRYIQNWHSIFFSVYGSYVVEVQTDTVLGFATRKISRPKYIDSELQL